MEIEKSVSYAIENIRREGLNDTFDRPFEVDLLNNDEFKKKVNDAVLRALRGNSFDSLGVNRVSHVLIPKSTAFDFRRCALIQPLDTIKYTALVLQIADTIEKGRIPIKEKTIFSYRFQINKGYLFNRNYTITAFLQKASEKSKRKTTRFIVSCDIANFYDRLNLHRLENQLLALGCEKTIVAQINELLFFWSNRDSYGLPVGTNASRILAEASLAGVDKYLREMGVDFIRFVDDYRMFARDASTAHYWLTLLIERLWREGLTINKQKTKIEASPEYKKQEEKKNKQLENTQTKNTENRRETNPFIIKAGYGGLVPTKFRKLTEKETAHYQTIDIQQKMDIIVGKDLIEPDNITEIIKAIISQKQYEQFKGVISALDKYPQLTPYVIDALIKHSELLSCDARSQIKELFYHIVDTDRQLPEYLSSAIIKLFGHRDFANKPFLMKLFRSLKRNSGAYIGRDILEALELKVSRDEAIEIRESFDRSDAWEKRQIVKIMKSAITEEERRPWLKTIRSIETSDIFLQEVISPTQKPKKKKRK